MSRTFLALAAAVACLSAGTTAARAVVIASDNYESYANGAQLNGQTGGTGFSGAYVVDSTKLPNVTAASKSLTYAGGAVGSSGGANAVSLSGLTDSVNLVSRPFTSQSATVYFSFLYNAGTGSQSNEDFLQFGLSDLTTGEPKSSVGSAGTAAGTVPVQFFVRVPNGGTSAFSGSGLTLAENTTYLLVGKASKVAGSSTYNQIDLYVNPTTLTEPATATATSTVAAGTGTASVSNFILRTARTEAADSYFYDNLTIGTTYADVVSAVPEPAAAGLLGAAAVGLLCRRRR